MILTQSRESTTEGPQAPVITANLPHSVVTDKERLQSPKERKTVQFPNLIIGQVNCIKLVLQQDW